MRAKSEVDYSVGKPHAHCGKLTNGDAFSCRHFLPARTTESGHCELVEGTIARNHWCKLFDRAAS